MYTCPKGTMVLYYQVYFTIVVLASAMVHVYHATRPWYTCTHSTRTKLGWSAYFAALMYVCTRYTVCIPWYTYHV
jgi:hypothetical protein